MTSLSILLVDDDEGFRERLARALRDRGHEVRTAGSPEEALQRAERGFARSARWSISACREAAASTWWPASRRSTRRRRWWCSPATGASPPRWRRCAGERCTTSPSRWTPTSCSQAFARGGPLPAERGPRRARGPVAGPGRVGAHPAGAHRRRGQRLRGCPPAGAAPQVAPAQAAEVPAPAMSVVAASWVSAAIRRALPASGRWRSPARRRRPAASGSTVANHWS